MIKSCKLSSIFSIEATNRELTVTLLADLGLVGSLCVWQLWPCDQRYSWTPVVVLVTSPSAKSHILSSFSQFYTISARQINIWQHFPWCVLIRGAVAVTSQSIYRLTWWTSPFSLVKERSPSFFHTFCWNKRRQPWNPHFSGWNTAFFLPPWISKRRFPVDDLRHGPRSPGRRHKDVYMI